jgi:hypothetical protein
MSCKTIVLNRGRNDSMSELFKSRGGTVLDWGLTPCFKSPLPKHPTNTGRILGSNLATILRDTRKRYHSTVNFRPKYQPPPCPLPLASLRKGTQPVLPLSKR